MWESQVLLTDGQVVFPRVLRFSRTFDERWARFKWNILERAVKPKSKKKKKKKKIPNINYYAIMSYANNEDSDQPTHQHRLVKVLLIVDTFYNIQIFWKRAMKAQIRLRECAAWSGPSLSAYKIRTFFSCHNQNISFSIKYRIFWDHVYNRSCFFIKIHIRNTN